MASIICDFCSDENPEWAYPAKDFEVKTVGSTGSSGSWAACKPCHDLIERNDYKALAMRSAKALSKNMPGVTAQHLVKGLKSLQLQFKANRTGPAKRLSSNDILARGHFAESDPTRPKSAAANLNVKFDREGKILEVGDQPTEGLKMTDSVFNQVQWPEQTENQPFSDEPPVVRHVMRDTPEGSETFFLEEGFTAEQLKDPSILQKILSQVKPGDGIDTSALTQGVTTPLVIPDHWEGSRTYNKVVGALIGELPRRDDKYAPSPAMVNSRHIIEPMATAHPLIIEPAQMDAIDDADWSLSEAHDYARMAHLPFEPLYLDFGGHHNGVHVDCSLGKAQMYGALVWRDTQMFKGGPTLAIAPFGAWDYLNRISVEYIQSKYKLSIDQMVHLTGGSCWYPGKSDFPTGRTEDAQGYTTRTFKIDEKAALKQWSYQSPGVMYFGPTMPDATQWATATVINRSDHGAFEVERVFAMPEAFHLIDEERIQNDPKKLGMVALTGLREMGIRSSEAGDRDDGHYVEVTPENNAFKEMLALNAELIGKMTERALLGLYFVENAPVEITSVPLSRQVRRDMERKGKEKVASIVVIRPSSGSRRNPDAEASERNYKYRWERRGYFMHIHSNNRHYQNRPDLVKPCHRCAREFAKGTEGVESPDCIKKWIEPTVCGPENLELRQKVRIKRNRPPEELAS